MPRIMPLAPEALPDNLSWDVSGLGGKGRYAQALARAALKQGPFDLVVCTHVHLLPIAYPVARLHRAPLVLFVYGIEVYQPTSKPLANRLVRHVDAVVSIRRNTTRSLRSWGRIDRVPTFQLENAIDLPRYAPGPKDPELVERLGLAGKRVIFTLSRLGETHIGVDEVLGAISRITREVPEAVYVVAGDGPDLPRLREKASALGVADRVVFAGFVPDARKADYLRLADVFAMPGSGPDFDRYPLRFVFLEAMACGVPVVGAVPEDPEERVTDGALLARQVDPDDPDAIARGVVEALSMPKAVPAGLERFGYPAFESRLHAIVDEAMSSARPTARAAAGT